MPLNDKIIKSDDVAKITAALIELGTIAYRADRTPVDQTEESINAQVDVIASTLSLSESFPNPATRHIREQVLNMATNVRDNAWPADVKEYMVLIEPMLRAYADSLALEPVRTTPPRMPAMSERLTTDPNHHDLIHHHHKESPMFTDAQKQRLVELTHAMQSGVKFDHDTGGDSGTPKHLRVGVNAAMVEHGALAKLMIDKGIITEDEYAGAVIAGMQTEVDRYESLLTAKLGHKVSLA
jgi:hypothetical protein